MQARYQKLTKDRVRLAVLPRRVCANQRSEIMVCDLVISATLVSLGAKERQPSDR